MIDDNFFLESELKALWLRFHPGVKCFDGETYFWYDFEKRTFLCQKPSNKRKNGIYSAYGLNSFLHSGLQKWADYLSC